MNVLNQHWHPLVGSARAVIRSLIVHTPGPQPASWAARGRWGRVWVDHVRHPRAAVCGVSYDYELIGRLPPDSPHRRTLRGLPLSIGVYARGPSAETLRSVFADREFSYWPTFRWPHGHRPQRHTLPRGYALRRLRAGDERLFSGFENWWMCNSFASAAQMCRVGTSWAVIHRGRMVSLANVFTLGSRFGDIGVGTQSTHQRRHLALACCRRLVAELLERGIEPSWATHPTNAASIRLARAVGFVPAGTIAFASMPAIPPDRTLYNSAVWPKPMPS
jgi:RimJ/RimL family protein N-acetyltransferase